MESVDATARKPPSDLQRSLLVILLIAIVICLLMIGATCILRNAPDQRERRASLKFESIVQSGRNRAQICGDFQSIDCIVSANPSGKPGVQLEVYLGPSWLDRLMYKFRPWLPVKYSPTSFSTQRLIGYVYFRNDSAGCLPKACLNFTTGEQRVFAYDFESTGTEVMPSSSDR